MRGTIASEFPAEESTALALNQSGILPTRLEHPSTVALFAFFGEPATDQKTGSAGGGQQNRWHNVDDPAGCRLLVEQTQAEQRREANEAPTHKLEADRVPLVMLVDSGFRLAFFC